MVFGELLDFIDCWRLETGPGQATASVVHRRRDSIWDLARPAIMSQGKCWRTNLLRLRRLMARASLATCCTSCVSTPSASAIHTRPSEC